MEIIDLRSDTVTTPTPEMREAMYYAKVGDDVYEEDPTVVELEQLGANLLGKEAGLFLPSGTMGNQVAVMSWTRRGNEVILEAESHMYYYEVGGLAVLSGVQVRTVKGERGVMNPVEVESAIRSPNIHFPETALICVENTHNRGGGKVIPLDNMRSIYEVAKRHNLSVHLDGARIFNASIYLKLEASELAKYADSVMFCLSKGLSAPVGSLLVGSSPFIKLARKYRKMLGGGMRQVGVIASAGVVALKTMINRLQEDHDNAKLLAEGLQEVPYLYVNPTEVETNMVIIEVVSSSMSAGALARALSKEGLFCNATSPSTIRLVTHKDINRQQILQSIAIFKGLKF
ncbi:MAG: L-allo-threonine aldolase [candidate division WS2 bacterium]|nr:L-allo-threonine aldolase [Candidatus Lithacetigena glycinireducens]MBT9175611.1 L-allo-threonine aldolase [Candidatus Lithacetigena glycinireducens]